MRIAKAWTVSFTKSVKPIFISNGSFMRLAHITETFQRNPILGGVSVPWHGNDRSLKSLGRPNYRLSAERRRQTNLDRRTRKKEFKISGLIRIFVGPPKFYFQRTSVRG